MECNGAGKGNFEARIQGTGQHETGLRRAGFGNVQLARAVRRGLLLSSALVPVLTVLPAAVSPLHAQTAINSLAGGSGGAGAGPSGPNSYASGGGGGAGGGGGGSAGNFSVNAPPGGAGGAPGYGGTSQAGSVGSPLSGGKGGNGYGTSAAGGAPTSSNPSNGGGAGGAPGAAGGYGETSGSKGAGGGGGGGHGYVGGTLPISAATGGAGGAGGLGWTPQSGTAIGGGGGGGGGFGAIITGSGNLGTLSVNATGGGGGAGGTGGYAGGGGYSGAGGAGLYIVNSGNFTSFIVSSTVSGGAGGGASGTSYGGLGGTGLFIYNSDGNKITVVDGAVIQGGKGGSVTDGTGWYSNLGPGTPGVGAAGISDYWGNTEIVLASGATVSGGLNGDLLDQNGNVTTAGVIRANAISFLGSGSNVLELQGNGASSGQSYAAINGNVVGSTSATTNKIRFSGAGGVFNLANLDFDGGGQFSNFHTFEINNVDPTDTWVMGGSPMVGNSPGSALWTVTKGRLEVGDGTGQGTLAVSSVTVKSAGTLSNTSTGAYHAYIGGNVTVESGGHLAAYMTPSSYAVQIFGNLTAGAGSNIDVKLTNQSNIALIQVGELFNPTSVTLGGTLNILPGSTLAEGSYDIVSFWQTPTGTLTMGTAPTDFEYQIVETSSRVQLLVTTAGLYWNGTTTSGSTSSVVGGNGTWTAAASGVTNWTNSGGTTHVVSDGSKAAIFAGTAGTVTVSAANGAVAAKGLKFVTTGYQITGDTLTLVNASAAPKIDVDGSSSAVAGIYSVLAGSDGIEKTGAGVLVLTGTNTYTGDTTLTAGNLRISGSGTLGSGSYAGAISLASGTGFNYASSAAQTLSGAISGSGALIKSGAGTLTLSGANTYSGATTINVGTLVASGGSAIGNASAVTVAGGASLTVDAGETIGSLAGAGSVSLTSLAQLNLGGDNTSTTFSGVISGSGGIDKSGSGTLTLSGANTLTGVVQVLAGGLVLSGGSRLPDTAEINLGTGASLELTGGSQSLKALNDATATPGTATVQLNANTLTLGEGNGTGSFSGSIAGTGGLTKVGSLNIVLSGTNTFTGPLQVSEGKVFLQGGAALADGVAATVASGAELVLQASETIGSLAGAGDVIGAGGARILTTGGNNADTTFSGTLFGSGGSLGLVKAGTGTLTLTGNNTYTGGTTISGGLLQIGDGGTTGSISGGVITNSGSNRGGIVFNRSDNVTYTGAISGSGTLEQKGTGTLTLTGSNMLSGTTTVSAGTLNVTGSMFGGAVDVKSGGTLLGNSTGLIFGPTTIENGGRLSSASGTYFQIGALSLGATSTFAFAAGAPTTVAAVYANGNLVLDGTLQLTTGAGFKSGTYRLIDYTGTLTDNGLAVGTVPAHSLYAVDTGTAGQVDLRVAVGQWWNGTNTTGGSSVSGGNGTWNVQAGTTNWTNEAGSAADAWGQGGIAVFGGTAGTVTIAGATNPQVAGLEFITPGYTIAGQSPSSAIRLTPLVAGEVPVVSVAEGTATIGVGLAGLAGFEKTGEGTLVLTRSGTIEGEATVSAGALEFQGDASLAGSLTVKSGASFLADTGATGGIALGLTLESGSTMRMEADGTSHLTVGSLTMQASTVLTVGLGAPSATAALAASTSSGGTGNLALNGTLDLTRSAGFSSGTFHLFDYAGALSGSIALGSVPQYSLAVLDTSTAGQVNLLVAAAQWWNGSTVTPGGSSVQGGNGVWNATAGTTNWTDPNGAAADAWGQGGIAMFAGTAGTVTVSGPTAPEVARMYFLTSGYTVTGGGLSLAGFNGQTPVITVGDATPSTSGVTATIASALAGSDGLVKAGSGTLTLNGDNTITGNTVVSAGSLVFGGGTSTAQQIDIGLDAGTVGSMTVTGSETSLDNGISTFNVGYAGTGSLTVSDGAHLATGYTEVGSQAGSVGTATVTGPGSIWTLANGLSVGRYASGTLVVSDGGTVQSSYLTIAYDDGAQGDVTVTGSGSSLNVGSYIEVGNSTDGTLTISDGASVTSAGAYIGEYTGYYRPGTGTATVTGAGSTWDMGTSSVTLGYEYAGTTGVLNIADGGVVTSGTGYLGYYEDTQGIVTVTGAGSKWDLGNAGLFVGYSGDGTVTVSGGGTILSGESVIGDDVHSDGAVTVTGAGSSWNLGTHLLAMGGYSGSGTLSVVDGGVVVAGQIGKVAGATAGSLTLDGGTLRASANQSDFVAGFAADDVELAAGGGTIDTNGFDVGVTSVLGGAGGLTKAGLGTLTLTGDNSYTGGTVVSSGTLRLGDGGTSGSVAGSIANSGTVVFDRSDDVVAGGAITGTGALVQAGTGTLTLVGLNSAGAGTTVQSGVLEVLDGVGLTSDVTVWNGARLRGETSGVAGASITGAVTVQDGGTLEAAPTGSAGVYGLSMTSLTLSSASNLDVTLGSNTGNAVFSTGALTLDGVVNVTDGGSLSLGVYRLIRYTGALTGNGLSVGTTPIAYAYQVVMQPGQVNLEVLNGDLLYWNGTTTTADGTVHGGSGTWTANAGQENWLTSPLNQTRAWNGGFAVFDGTAGTVSVDNGQGLVQATGLQFMVDGYVVDGAALTLAPSSGQPQINVGDGTPSGASYTATIAAPLQSMAGFEKTGLGTLILTGTNIYSGETTVTQGTLQIGDGGTGGSILGFASVAADATLAFDKSTQTTFSGVVYGEGRLVQKGTGTLVLTGSNTYTGGTSIGAGSTLQVGSGTIGSIVGDVENDGTLSFARSDATTFAGVISGTGALVKDGAGTLTLSGTNTFTGATTVSAGQLSIMGGSSLSDTARLSILGGATLELVDSDETVGSLDGGGAAVLNGYCLTTGGDGTNSTFSGTISGAGCLKKTGTGTLTLTGTNTQTGVTTVSEGAIDVGAAAALGSGGLALEGEGRLIASTGFSYADPVSLSPLEGDGGGTFEVATAQTLTLSGVVSGTGTLTKSGDGILSLTGTNTYSGATTVTGGELRIANGASLSDTARLLVGGGALVTLTNADETIGSLAGGGTVALSGYCLTAGGDGSNSAFSGTISGPGCLTKTGTGTLTLTGTNTMDGPVTVAGGGTVQVTAAAALGTGTLALQSGGTLRASGTFTYGAPVSLTSGGGTFEVDGNDGYETLTLTGPITGGGALNKTGLGWLVIAGTNTATGPTNVAAGTLQATGGNALGDESAVSVAAGARLIVDGSETTGSLAGDGQVTLSSGTLSLGGSNADAAFAGTLDGAGGLTKIGTGTQTLTGISTYAGDTAVQGGRLAVEGSLTDSDVYVYDQATLSGGGTITKTVHVLDGGTLAGTQTSGLTMGALDLQAGANLGVTLGAVGGSGVFNVTGNVTLAGQVNVTAAPGFGFGIYRIMSYGGTMTDNGITVGAMPEGYAGGVQTSVAGRVNLFVEDPNSPVIFWNGANTTATQTVLGGTGTWTAGPQTNWINASGTIPKAWNSGFAVFQGSPGTVTVDDSQGQVTVAGMQFVESGYVVTGDAIALSGSSQATVRVGDGTVEGAGTVATIASALTGTGGLEKSDYGTLILTGASTYSGGTTVAQGTLQIGNGGTSGSIAGNVADNATLVFNRSDATTFAGAISGTGSVTQAGTGTLTLAGNNSYAGGTRLNAGTLAVATSTALGSGGLSMSEGTTLAFAADGLNLANAVTLNGDPTVSVGAGQTGTLSGVLSDGTAPGDIVKTGAGTLVFAADNTYSGGTTISAGTLQLGNGGTAGSLVGNVTDNGVLAFNRADSVTFAGVVSGTGSLVQAGTGTLTLTGANTYSGGTTVASGTLAGNATSLQGNIANNGAVVFDQAGTGTYAGVVSGTGSLTKTGTGTLILTGENTYSGGTTISAGTLQLGNGGPTGSVTGDIVNNAALVFNRAGTYDFPGTITGSGSVTILTGTVNFLAANGYTGPISVEGSEFLLSPGAVSASSFTIGSGGLIGGSGTIAGLTVLDGGTVAPGYSPGTLTVNGNVSFAPGSVYVVDITPSGEHDLIAASGTATITGGTVQVVAVEGTYVPGTTYTILTAQGGVTGTFDGVTANYAFLDPSLGYDANDVYLTVMRNATPFPAAGNTANQRAVAGAVESLGAGNPVYDAVVQLSAAEAPLAFDSMTGEAYASAAVVLQQQSSYLREAVGARLRQGLDGGKATAGQQAANLAPGYDATVWAQGYGAWGQTAGNGNAASLDRSIGGFFAGVDAAFGEAWRVGAVAGYSRSTFDVDARSSSGDSDNYDLGLYAGGKFGALKLLGGLSYTWHDVSLDRTVAFSGYAGANGADYKAGTTQVFGEAGWTIALDKALDPKTFGKATLEPFVGLAYVNLSSDDVTETGSTSALTGSLDTQNTLYSTLGIRAATEFALGNGATLVPHLSLGWQHAFGDVNTSAALAFTSGGTPFSVAGLPIARDTAILGAGIDYDFTDKVSASLSYNGQFASGVSDNAFKGSLNIRF